MLLWQWGYRNPGPRCGGARSPVGVSETCRAFLIQGERFRLNALTQLGKGRGDGQAGKKEQHKEGSAA